MQLAEQHEQLEDMRVKLAQINATLQSARNLTGIATVVKALIVALFLGGLSQAALPTANAQTNSLAGGAPALQDGTTTAP